MVWPLRGWVGGDDDKTMNKVKTSVCRKRVSYNNIIGARCYVKSAGDGEEP